MSDLKTNNGITWFEAPSLKMGGIAVHAFSTRFGGNSVYPWRGLNLGLFCGDRPEVVRENRRLFMYRFAIEPSQVASLRFIHSNKVVVVDQSYAGTGFLEASDELIEADAMVTDLPGIALFVTFADCVPILFLEPEKKIIAAAHAGWRGTVSGIAINTVEKMVSEFAADRRKIRVAIGPHISQDNFEVGSDVINAVQAHSGAWIDLLSSGRKGRALFNMQKALIWQLESIGILREQIETIDRCTFERHDLFFSHRRAAGPTGRMAAFIMLS